MNDEDRAALVEAGARRCSELADEGDGYLPSDYEIAAALLDAFMAVCRPVPCPTCNGAGHVPHSQLPQSVACVVCHGTGSVPGSVPLLMVRGEQVGWVNDLGSFGPAAMANARPVFVDAGVSVPTPETCPECGGDGLDGSHEAALYYADRGDISYCEACNGSGSVPTPKEEAE